MICTCGNDRFYGHQIIRADVIVGADGSFKGNVMDRLEDSIYDSEKPYRPFTCTTCGKKYEELEGGVCHAYRH